MALIAFALYLCSRMTVETGYWTAARNMVIVGAGMGMTFPVFSLAVQNAVPYRVMGIAMSSMQFFRTLGGMMGTAIMGAIMTNGFRPAFEREAQPALDRIAQVTRTIPPAALAQLPERAQVALRNPTAMFENPQILLAPEAMKQLQENFARFPGGDQILAELLNAVRASLAGALSPVFLWGSAILAVGFVIALFLGEKPLRKSNLEGMAAASEHSPAVAAEQSPVPPPGQTPAHEAEREREPVAVGD
jgi:hypothetical protein